MKRYIKQNKINYGPMVPTNYGQEFFDDNNEMTLTYSTQNKYNKPINYNPASKINYNNYQNNNNFINNNFKNNFNINYNKNTNTINANTSNNNNNFKQIKEDVEELKNKIKNLNIIACGKSPLQNTNYNQQYRVNNYVTKKVYNNKPQFSNIRQQYMNNNKPNSCILVLVKSNE